VRVLRPGGAILASGFEVDEIQGVQSALPPAREIRQKGNWVLLII
jgi:hypothetical protein